MLVKTYVLYHSNCPDGTVSALLLDVFRSRWTVSEIVFIPVNYDDGDKTIERLQRETTHAFQLVFADFCFDDVKVMQTLISLAVYTFVFDHHETAERVLRQIRSVAVEVVYDQNLCGCAIVRDWLETQGANLGEGWTMLVNYVQDRDLWKFKLPYTKPIGAYIRQHLRLNQVPQYKLTENVLEPLCDCARWLRASDSTLGMGERPQVLVQGELIESIRERMIGAYRNRIYLGEFLGHKVAVVNISHTEITSEVLHKAEGLAESGIAIGWWLNGGDFYFSVRSSKEGPNVAELCETFGGGGHEHAAGFNVSASRVSDIASFVFSGVKPDPISLRLHWDSQ